MWTIESHEDVSRRLKKYKKKWPHEMKNVFDNLDTLHDALSGGTRPEQLKSFGFVHSEPAGVLAVDQKGPGKGAKLKQFRLYVYPEEEQRVLYVRILGDKSTQVEDLKLVTSFVKGLTERKAGGELGDTCAG